MASARRLGGERPEHLHRDQADLLAPLAQPVHHAVRGHDHVLEAAQHGARPQQLGLVRGDEIHPAHDVGALERLLVAVDDRGAGLLVLVVGEPGGAARVPLHDDRVPRGHQLPRGPWRQSHPPFVTAGLAWHSEIHACTPS